MSTLVSNNPGGRAPVRKRGMDIYTVMLLLSVIFMLIAVIAMTIEMWRYAPDYYNTSAARPGVGMLVMPIR